jgi:hypothetical protein
MVAMITAYFDESGTHGNQKVDPPVLSIGCYVSTGQQWELFKQEWQAVLDKAGVECFHAAPFESRFREYADWTDKKRKGVYVSLQSIIKRRVKKVIAACVVLPDYDELITGEHRQMLLSPYAFAVRCCFEMIGEWSRRHELRESVDCVFEAGARMGGEVGDVFKRVKAKNNLGSLSYGVKKDPLKMSVPLQAADVLAYEIRKLAITVVGCMRDEKRKLFMRRSIQNLFGFPHETYYFDRDALTEIISAFEAGGVLE